MECQSEVKNNSGDPHPQSSGMAKKVNARPASRSLKLGERFTLERPTLSYADFRHEITKDTGCATLQSPEHNLKPKTKIKAAEDDELVRYMSNLPGYLERRDNLNDAPFSIGVLDWGRLEKWKQKSKRILNRSRDYSPASSTDSTCFLIDVSFSKSSRGHSCSPAHQSVQHPTLQSYLNPSLREADLDGVSSSPGNSGNFQDPKASLTGSSYGQEKYVEKDQPFPNYQSKGKQEGNEEKYFEPEIIQKMKLSSYLINNEVTSFQEGISKTGDGDYVDKLNKAAKSNSNILNCDFPEGNRKVVLLVPKVSSLKTSSGALRLNDSVGVMDQRLKEVHRRISCCKAIHHTGLSDSPHSAPLTSHDGKHRPTSERPINAQSRMSLDASYSQCSTKAQVNKSTGQGLPENRAAVTSSHSTEIKPSYESNMSTAPVEAVKARTFLPTRRFSFSMGIAGKHFQTSTLHSGPSCIRNTPKDKGRADSMYADSSKGDKLSATTRARSTPLRRLLDPLLNPKELNSHCSASPLRKFSVSRDREAGRSSIREANSLADHSAKVKLDSTCTKSISRSNSPKHGSAKVQSLLKVTIKNGLPLFTFATEDYKEILAATVKKLSTLAESENSYLYTFFTFREMKKKSWINQGDKSKSHDYMPNVVAQMEVSEFSGLTGDHSVDQYVVKECVLFAVDLRQTEKDKDHLKPNDELAAIVVKIPNKRSGNLDQDELRSRDYPSTTVVLPNVIHTLPRKGEPSSLVERWKSGGICDCGGWDLGCKLRVFSDKKQFDKGLTQSNSRSMDRFQLFNKGEVQGGQSIFDLTKFRDGIFSVEFDSSISLLQAFSICMAVVDSKEPYLLPEPRTYFGVKSSEESKIVHNDDMNGVNKTQAQVPARYASYLHNSPAERV